MILCVTLNPCLDKTLTVPPWRPGDLVRGVAVRDVVGGKGNNVARALLRLGRKPRPVTFLGGAIGSLCERMLRDDDHLEPLVVQTEAPTRVILTVRTESTPDQTAFFDPDPAIKAGEAEALLDRVDLAMKLETVEALTLSGSSPAAATHSVYSDLIALAQPRGIPVFLDTYGPALDRVWGFWPASIQLNRREAAVRLRKPKVTDADVAGLLADWGRHGVTCGIVTDGPDPVWAMVRGKVYRAVPPPIKAVNPIGSGDSLLAGLVDGWLRGLEVDAMLQRAVACAVANALVWDAGAIESGAVDSWQTKVVIERVGLGAR
jgi:1-phosphofructokinase family hexose kinase